MRQKADTSERHVEDIQRVKRRQTVTTWVVKKRGKLDYREASPHGFSHDFKFDHRSQKRYVYHFVLSMTLQQFLHVNLAIGASVISLRATFRFVRRRVWAQVLTKGLPRSSVFFATTPVEIVGFWRVVAPWVRKVLSQ